MAFGVLFLGAPFFATTFRAGFADRGVNGGLQLVSVGVACLDVAQRTNQNAPSYGLFNKPEKAKIKISLMR